MTIPTFMHEDHQSLADLLNDLTSALNPTSGQHDVVRIFRLLDLFWAKLAVHIRAENVCIFPAIETMPVAMTSAK